MARNRAIGKDNQMLWRLSTDMKRFRRITTGHCILMGRKTFESLGKPLPGRTNIVVTRNKDYRPEGTVVFSSIYDGIDHARKQGEEELFVIGGGTVYEQCLDRADRLYLTRVLADPEGDAFFPDFDESEWEVVREEAHLADERNEHAFIFLDLERRGAKSARG